MKYKNIHKGILKSRPNRFIAQVEIDGVNTTVHVKNTGRCKELLRENATVFLEKSDNPQRKTKYDLVAVYKGDRLINMDSQAPNIVFGEFLKKNILIKNTTQIKPEHKFNNSRFDFYVEADNRKIFLEVKGVTLEENNVVMFPDNDPLHSIFTSPLVKYNLDPERVRTSLVFTESFFNLKLESVNDDLYLSIVM